MASTTTSYSFNASASRTLVANFSINTYTLTYTAGAGGTISGTSPQTVNYNSSGTSVRAVANTGYHFVNWNDGSIANPRTDTSVTANRSVSANFAIDTFTLSYVAGPNGTLTGTAPQAVNYGASGTSVTAVPATGYHFVSWNDGSTANPRTDTNVRASVNVAASFAPNAVTSYTLMYTAGTNGSISGTTSQTIASGASGTSVTAVASTGYHFVGWSDGSTTNPRTDTGVTANINVSATFAANAVTTQAPVSYTVTYTAGTNGSISGTSPQTITSGASGTAVTAVASTGYHFVSWSDGSAANPRTDSNVVSNISVTANFAINPLTSPTSPASYIVIASAGSHGSITPAGPVVVNSGTNQTFTFRADSGYRVAHLIVDGKSVGTSSSYTFANVTHAHTISVTFAPSDHHSRDSEDNHHHSDDHGSSYRLHIGSD